MSSDKNEKKDDDLVHFREFSSSHKLKLEGAFDSSGLYYGTHRFWDENGNLFFEAEFNLGNQISSKYYYQSGKLKSEKFFKNGKFDHIHRDWFPNGTLHKEICWSKGRMHGPYRIWHNNGQLFQFKVFNNDKLISLQEWDTQGKLVCQR